MNLNTWKLLMVMRLPNKGTLILYIYTHNARHNPLLLWQVVVYMLSTNCRYAVCCRSDLQDLGWHWTNKQVTPWMPQEQKFTVEIRKMYSSTFSFFKIFLYPPQHTWHPLPFVIIQLSTILGFRAANQITQFQIWLVVESSHNATWNGLGNDESKGSSLEFHDWILTMV